MDSKRREAVLELPPGYETSPPGWVLGIETSCDETAAAIVGLNGAVRANIVHSQISLHAPHGGIVPELAARDHAKRLAPTVQACLDEAELKLTHLRGIAVTNRPGLSGALLVGLQFAKGLAWSTGLPLIGVDHLVGHLLSAAVRFEGAPPTPPFPFIGLLASGGHTGLYRVAGPQPSQMTELGATRDDAAGEAFDKAAKLLGLGYPGGPVIDKLAEAGDPSRISPPLPTPMANRRSLEFSFSGIKTALARRIEEKGVPAGQELHDLCAAFQGAVVKTLARKAVNAALDRSIPRIVIGGGVSANRGLSAELRERTQKNGLELFVPPLKACTDNAAMIAFAGAQQLAAGAESVVNELSVSTQTQLRGATRKGGGQRKATGSEPRAPVAQTSLLDGASQRD